MSNLMNNKFLLSINFPNEEIMIETNEADDGTVMKRNISYSEVFNYHNARFPVRLLTVTMTGDELQKLVGGRIHLDPTKNKLFDITLSSTSINVLNYTHNSPVQLGEFKCTMKNNESLYNSIQYFHGRDKLMEQNINTLVNVEFMLYKENELKLGLNTEINFLSSEANLATIFLHGKNLSMPNHRLVMSEFGHNPVIPKFLVPTMGFDDFVEMLDVEFGLYKTGYSVFFEDDLMYFLNKSFNPNVTVPSLDYDIYLKIGRQTDEGTVDSVTSSGSGTDVKSITVNIPSVNYKVNVNNNYVLDNDPIYIESGGPRSLLVNSSGRRLDTVRKLTSIKNLSRDSNIQYEYVDINLGGLSNSKITPLTKITYLDSVLANRVYRVMFKSTDIISGRSVTTKVVGFREL